MESCHVNVELLCHNEELCCQSGSLWCHNRTLESKMEHSDGQMEYHEGILWCQMQTHDKRVGCIVLWIGVLWHNRAMKT